MGTDYFTKWVEVVQLQNIVELNMKNFIWKNIITRFGVPRALISDNGTQFKKKTIREFSYKYGIQQYFFSVAYSQSNGQAEASNKVILDGLKKRLERAKGKWVRELPLVSWAFRTTPRRSTSETSFSLSYGIEEIITLEVGLPTLRTAQVEAGGNDVILEEAMELVKERR